MELQKNKVFVQIGTNDGFDEFNSIVRQYEPSLVILVEPNKLLNDRINYHYQGVNNYHIENLAITEENKGVVNLVMPKDMPGYNRSVNGIHYEDKGYSLLPMNDWGNDFVTISAESMTFNDLCEKYGINDIHYLQIDTEGYDYEIIKAIYFNKVNIDIIKYENWGFDINCFTRHEKFEQYGINGLNTVTELLTNLGYELEKLSDDTLAVKK